MTDPVPRKRLKRQQYHGHPGATDDASGPGSSPSTGAGVPLPRKRLYRQRAHANPFSDHQLEYPANPAEMDWAAHFPAYVAEGEREKGSQTGTTEATEAMDTEAVDTEAVDTEAVQPRPRLAHRLRLDREVEVADIGCGFGGLLVALAPLMPETLMVGMEIRTQVLDYVNARINALRLQHASSAEAATSTGTTSTTTTMKTTTETNNPNSPPPSVPAHYQNISALRTNTMKFLPNFFRHHQLSKIFICFPDPHFKARKHKARIVSAPLNAEYAYVLRPGGLLYTITDVEDMHRWIVAHFEGRDEDEDEGEGEGESKGEGNDESGEKHDHDHDHADADAVGGAASVRELWERVDDETLAADPCVRVMRDETEEGKKVARNDGQKFVAVWRRRPDPKWP